MIGDPEFDQVYEENRVDIDAVLLALGEEIENNKKFYATYVRNALLDTISGEELVNLYLNYRDALIEVGVELDANQIMLILTNEIESNREAYATWARNAIIDTMSDEELISYYLHYRPELLEDIYQGLKDRFAMASSAPVPSSPLPATQRTVILQEAVEEEAAPPVVVPPSPSPAVQRTVILQEVVEEEAAPSVVVEEKPAPPAPRVPVSPSVTTKPTTVPYEMTPAEYETLRQEKRNEALDEILKKIG